MSSTTCKILYILYTLLTGLTFSSIFILYSISSIIYVFLLASLSFLVFALIGRFTNINILKFGSILFMLLLSVVILEIINIFIGSNTLNMGLCIVGLLIFYGYIIYDIKRVSLLVDSDIDNDNVAIIGAFSLYLDFINIFIRLLELFGKRRD